MVEICGRDMVPAESSDASSARALSAGIRGFMSDATSEDAL